MSGPDLEGLMRRAQEMQQKLNDLQQDLARRSVEGDAGAGLVRVVMSGDLRVQRVEIEPSILGAGDPEMVQDLVAGAVNAAIANAQQMVQQEMQRAAAANLPFPGGGGPGGPPAS